MPAYWLTFKPHGPNAPRGWPIENLKDLVRRFDAGRGTATEWWRIQAHRSARVGDRVYLFKQGGDPRGIFGVGEIVEGPRFTATSSDQKEQWRARIHFETLVDPTQGFLLQLEEIDDLVPLQTITAQASGTRLEDKVADELENRLAPRLPPTTPPIGSGQADDVAFDPQSVDDECQRALRAIRIRRGQPLFRAALLEAYGKRCAITRCAVEDVLEAAHIIPYHGPLTNDLANGLLLRADIHTLFDCGLLAIDPKTRQVDIAEALKGSPYKKIAGRKLLRPKNERDTPSTRNLEKRFASFKRLAQVK